MCAKGEKKGKEKDRSRGRSTRHRSTMTRAALCLVALLAAVASTRSARTFRADGARRQSARRVRVDYRRAPSARTVSADRAERPRGLSARTVRAHRPHRAPAQGHTQICMLEEPSKTASPDRFSICCYGLVFLARVCGGGRIVELLVLISPKVFLHASTEGEPTEQMMWEK